MNKRRVAAISLFALVAGPPLAQADQCPDLFKMLGYFTHAAFVCDKTWLQSPAMETTGRAIGNSKSCKAMSKSDARIYVALGMNQFDQETNEKGLYNACKGANGFMKAVGRE